MKRTLYPRFLILTCLFIASSVSVWGEDITFDISKGDVRFTDDNYTGYVEIEGKIVTKAHDPDNHYIISGTTTEYNIQVGTKDDMVITDFIIYLNGVKIKRSGDGICAFSIYNSGSSVVAVILQDNSENILYSGGNRAGLEKSGGEACNGTLLITCEAGYKKWLENPNHGHTEGEHNESACTTCGHLDARSGNAWDGSKAETYEAGAGIGTAGYGSGGSNQENAIKGTNALVNLTIAGGNIEARGAWGYAGGTSGGAAAIGTGCASGSSKTAGTITGLTITGGTINAYRIDNSAACIGGGYRSGYVNIDIYGGTIDATLKDKLQDNTNNSRVFNKMRAAAIGGGGGGDNSSSPAGATVTIYNGIIKAEGQYGAAIGSGSGGSEGYGQYAKVIIHNGDINASTNKGLGEGSGAAIGSGGSTGTGHAGNADITINGGKIVASSELGADIGGGGTNSASDTGYGGKGNVTITGGTIEAKQGGIGGGRANAGEGGDATITISGTDTDIKAYSIGGGTSEKQSGGNVTLTVNDGKLTVANFIGGGIGGEDDNLIGWAKVYIKGGEISGRTVMQASTTEGCVFEMSGGTLTSPITDQPGGAVYMVDPEGVATLSGGTIQNCTGTTGGAVYMTGGTFNISGGTVSDCQGTSGGGAVYMEGGKFTISQTAKMQNNTAPNGGAVYLARTGKVFVEGGTIQNNTVTEDGGAVYMAGGEFTMTNGTIDKCQGAASGAIYMSDGKFTISGGTISGSTGATNGGAVYLNGNGQLKVDGGTIQNNTVTTDGGAIYMANGNVTMTAGTIDNCYGANSGAIYMSGGEFTISNGTISNCTGAKDGGAVYLAGAGTVQVNGGTFIGNTVTANGGAVYMADGTFTMTAGTIDNCQGANGGALYMSKGAFTITGNAVMKSNSATDGGAVYLAGTGALQVNGGSIQNNTVTGNGGAIYLQDGTFTMSNGEVKANQSTDGNGAGIYIANGTVTLTGGEVSENIATVGKGGGFFVGGGNVTLSGTITSNKAKKAGGGIYLENATITVNNCTLTENEATAGNGGGIFLSKATMTYNGGIVTFNKATGTGDFTTGYKAKAEDIQGVGGGIYISSNSSLTFGSFNGLGVYANSASMAADDLFANGDNTSLLVPNITKMKLQDYAGNADGLGWYEDYFTNDTEYDNDNVAKGNAEKKTFDHRFKEAQELGQEYMRVYQFDKESVTLKDTYIAFALGFLFSDLTIQVEGLKPGESCIFSVQGTAEGGKYKYQVPVHGTNNQYDLQKIIRLPVDKYTVTLLEGWPWAYNIEEDKKTITEMNSKNGGIYEFTLQHKPTSITHDEEQVKVKL